MRTLVTGAGGFLGLYITEQLLARGESVRAFCRGQYPALDALGVEVYRGDLQDRAALVAACEGIECVYHVAAVAGIWGPWKLYHGTNTVGTQNVIAACQAKGVQRLVYSSSPSVTFAGEPQEGIDESAPYPEEWLCHYPHSKALAEQAVLAANGDGDLATCAVRPHLIWGPRDGHLIPRLIRRARRGRLRRVGDGNNRIDMIYVENAAQAHLMAADALDSPQAPAAGRAFFISQGDSVVCWQWIDEILAAAGLPPVERSISLPAAWRLGAACEAVYRTLGIKREPPMTRFLAAQLGTSHWFDTSAAGEILGYHPRISTAEGMQRLQNWLAEHPVSDEPPHH